TVGLAVGACVGSGVEVGGTAVGGTGVAVGGTGVGGIGVSMGGVAVGSGGAACAAQPARTKTHTHSAARRTNTLCRTGVGQTCYAVSPWITRVRDVRRSTSSSRVESSHRSVRGLRSRRSADC